MHQICCWHSQQSAKLGQRGELYSLVSDTLHSPRFAAGLLR